MNSITLDNAFDNVSDWHLLLDVPNDVPFAATYSAYVTYCAEKNTTPIDAADLTGRYFGGVYSLIDNPGMFGKAIFTVRIRDIV